MSVFELYEKYLYNSISFGSQIERNQRIIHEKNELTKIIYALDNIFYKDKDILDKKNHSVYSLIKKEMAKEIVSSGDKFKNIIDYYRFYLRGLLNRITIAQVIYVTKQKTDRASTKREFNNPNECSLKGTEFFFKNRCE